MATIDTDNIGKVASTNGLCIIIDKFDEKHLKKASLLRTEKELHDLSFVIEMNKDVSIMKMQHMFGSMNYDAHYVNGPKPLTAMKKILQDNHNTDYKWLVVLIVGSGEHVRDEDINPQNSRYKHFWKQLSGEAFSKTPKLLIEHLVTTDQDDSHTTSAVMPFPIQNIVFVCSRIEISGLPPESDLLNWMFIDELNDVCSRYAHKRDVITLLTLIRQRLEIQMYSKEKPKIDGGEKKGYVSQYVTFCTELDTSGIPNIAIDTKCNILLTEDEILPSKIISCLARQKIEIEELFRSEGFKILETPDIQDGLIETCADKGFETRIDEDDPHNDIYKENDRLSTKDLQKTLLLKYAQDINQAKKSDTHYPMDQNPRGFCIIINISNDRLGSTIDQVKMDQLFTELFFETKIIVNKNHQSIHNELSTISDTIPEEHQALFVIIMAHGGTDDKGFHTFCDVTGTSQHSSYIFTTFDGVNCPNLLGKPKVFIVQTCFGSKQMDGVNNKSRDSHEGDLKPDVKFFTYDNTKDIRSGMDDTVNVPHKMSDVITVHANMTGFVSQRHIIEGSFLIESVDEEFRKSASNKSLADILTEIWGCFGRGSSTIWYFV